MAYKQKDFKETNVNYINKDFASLKNNLMEYAKSYFPTTYKDFNETSPGMMLIEMSAYVGDVLSFYIDQQYQEMLLPLAEEKRNVINIAKMLGYKVKPIIPSYVTLTVKQVVGTDGDTDNPQADYTEAVTIDKGMQITSTFDSDTIFETLDVVDFKVSGSGVDADNIEPEVTDYAESGVASEFTITRRVKAISAETKTKTFTVGAPSKFKELTLSDTNVVDIVSVYDSNGNQWYEVDYLAQDRVPIETHYSDDTNRNTAYTNLAGGTETLPVPYTLEFIRTDKRFITEINDDNTTTLVFGNGLLRSGQTVPQNFMQTEQIGITIPGVTQNLVDAIDSTLGDEYSTLGETPMHTVLTVTYRVGGGVSANVARSDLTTHDYAGAQSSNISVTNEEPARGGSDQESIDEIRHRAKAHFSSQRRCVTREDYEARILQMPAKFGNVAKVYVERQSLGDILASADVDENGMLSQEEIAALLGGGDQIPTIDVYTLSYDINKYLVSTPNIIHQNLKKYLDRFRIITDEVNLMSGYVINFGVIFDVVSHKHANKHEVKLKCINKITDYFNVSGTQFRQPIHVSDLEYELMGIDGVRSVNYVCLTQDNDWEGASGIATFDPPLYLTHWDPTSDDGNGAWTSDGTSGYGYKYDFQAAHTNGTIRPSSTPAIFELKYPKQNIKGRVQ